jgi:hypothetical protein
MPFKPSGGWLGQRYCSVRHGQLGRWQNWHLERDEAS